MCNVCILVKLTVRKVIRNKNSKNSIAVQHGELLELFRYVNNLIDGIIDGTVDCVKEANSELINDKCNLNLMSMIFNTGLKIVGFKYNASNNDDSFVTCIV